LDASQLRKTDNSLTWRIQAQGMDRVRHMSLDETPYKIALDFYSRGGLGRDKGEASKSGPAKEAAAVAPAQPRPSTPVPSKETGSPPPAPAKAGKDELTASDRRLDGLPADERRRLLVGELLLQLGDSAGAMAYLEQVAARHPNHPWGRFLLAQAYLGKGDEYRARALLEPLTGDAKWKSQLQPLLARLASPDAQGVVPGGEMVEEDLSFYLAVLRQGGGLGPADLYRKPEKEAGKGSMTIVPGLLMGAVLGLVAFAVAELRLRRKVDALVRERILNSDSPRPSPVLPRQDDLTEYAEVSRRVREELGQVMQEEGAPILREPTPAQAEGQGATQTRQARGEASIEERVYQLADERKSIVEIAEELNLGVDEVRLHLELREQAGRVGNG
jgi:hypothetical protein